MLCIVEAEFPKACIGIDTEENCKYRDCCPAYQNAFNDYSIKFERWLSLVEGKRHPDCPFKEVYESEDTIP